MKNITVFHLKLAVKMQYLAYTCRPLNAIDTVIWTYLDKQHIRAQVCSAALNVFPPGVLKNNKHMMHVLFDRYIDSTILLLPKSEINHLMNISSLLQDS